jgi:hypothetical protein
MPILIDTSILGRLANRSDAAYPLTAAAIASLHRRGEILNITSQNLIEFRNFSTRPLNVNGLGLAPSVAEELSKIFESSFPILPETPSIHPT